VLFAEVLTDEGERGMLYSDWIYAVFPQIKEQIWEVLLEQNRQALMELERWIAADYREFTRQIVDWAVPTYRETLAYKVASKSGELPTKLEADALSPYCFFGDRDSPFRVAMKPRVPDLRAFRLEMSDSPIMRQIPRSNLVEAYLSVRDHHPVLWNELTKHMADLASEPKSDLARKAAHIRDRLDFVLSDDVHRAAKE
jgi:hypothetical protein